MDVRKPPEPPASAFASLVLGVGGVVLCAVGFALLVGEEPGGRLEVLPWVLGLGLLCAGTALVLGLIALRRLRTSAGNLVGRGRVTPGIAASLLGLVLCTVLAGVWLHGRTIRLQRNACINNLCQIECGKNSWATEVGRTSGWAWASDTLAFKELVGPTAGFIKAYPVCPLSTNAGASRTTVEMAVECYQVNPISSRVVCRLHRHQLKYDYPWWSTSPRPNDWGAVVPSTPSGKPDIR